MGEIRKLMICPWFGPLPTWHRMYLRNVKATLAQQGYDFQLLTDVAEFRQRAADTLNVHYPDHADPRKPCAYRVTFGVMYADLIDGYDFWGHTDLDCVYGRTHRFVTDDLLEQTDIQTDHHYLCGPWTLYRNTPSVNQLFLEVADWRRRLEDPVEVGWGETVYTDVLAREHQAGRLRWTRSAFHVYTVQELAQLRRAGTRLLVNDTEVMMGHFRRSKPKVYPRRCRL